MGEETAGFALVPVDVRRAGAELAAAAGEAQEAGRDLVASLRALAAAVPGSRAGPAAEALASVWEVDTARWVAGARRLGEALVTTAADGAAADETLARLLAGDLP